MKDSVYHALRTNPARTITRRCDSRAGFTMFEVLLVVIALGLLAALVVPTVDRFFDATNETTKVHNAQMLNQYADTLYNAGYDVSKWTDAATAITDLQNGVTIASVIPNGTNQVIRLKQAINAKAYTFTAGTPPTFSADLTKRTEKP